MTGPLTRLGTYLGLDRNPLRRRRDRIEARVRLTLAALLVLGGPALALWSAGRVHDDLLARARTQQAGHHLVTAVVRTPGEQQMSEMDGGRTVVVHATARMPSGRDRDVRVPVPAGTHNGDTVRVWVDSREQVVQRPLTAQDATWTAVFTGLMVPPMLGMLVWAVAAGVRALCMRLAEDDWERAWASADTQWRGHPPR